MATKAQTAATLHSEIGSSTYASPPSAAHRQILAALRADGILTASGSYASGKGQADLLKTLSVPSITQETLERLAGSRGI